MNLQKKLKRSPGKGWRERKSVPNRNRSSQKNWRSYKSPNRRILINEGRCSKERRPHWNWKRKRNRMRNQMKNQTRNQMRNQMKKSFKTRKSKNDLGLLVCHLSNKFYYHFKPCHHLSCPIPCKILTTGYFLRLPTVKWKCTIKTSWLYRNFTRFLPR